MYEEPGVIIPDVCPHCPDYMHTLTVDPGTWGDRKQSLVFIGRGMQRDALMERVSLGPAAKRSAMRIGLMDPDLDLTPLMLSRMHRQISACLVTDDEQCELLRAEEAATAEDEDGSFDAGEVEQRWRALAWPWEKRALGGHPDDE